MPADFESSAPETTDAASSWSAHERRIFAVEVALRSLAQGSGPVHAKLTRLVRELIEEYRGWQEGEIAAMKRAGAVALQCARVMDAMEKRLEQAAEQEDLAPLSQEFACELQRLRTVAYEHLSSALNRENARERSRFPVVFLN